jgi:acyl-coenzyme A thioesterase 13
MKPRNDIDVSQVEGNASPEIKRAFLSTVQHLGTPRQSNSRSTGELFRGFETELLSRLRLVDVSILPKAEEPEKVEGRIVFELIADGGVLCFLMTYTQCSRRSSEMLSDYGTMHGGCTAMLIDQYVFFYSTYVRLQLSNEWIHRCSSMSIYVLGLATSGYGTLGVSLSLNTTYHSPALLYVQKSTRSYVVLKIVLEATSYAL